MAEDMRNFEAEFPSPVTPAPRDRIELRRLAAEVNRTVDSLSWTITRRIVGVIGVPSALGALGSVDGTNNLAEQCAHAALGEVATVLAQKDEALFRGRADAERLGELARAHWGAAQRLRGELAVALQQRDQEAAGREQEKYLLLVEINRLKGELTAGLDLHCASNLCTYLAIDLADLAEHGRLCHPAASPSDPGGVL